MNIVKNSTIILLTFCISTIASAEITVTALQPPVWKESNGNRSALFPGDTLLSNDNIFTGKDSRVLLDFNEGSIVEIGEDTTAKVDVAPITKRTLTSQNNSGSITTAAFRILKGAFRYTAQKLTSKRKRDIKINLTTSTIGIRGTDLWGRSSDNEDFVVLIEGDIVINHQSKQQVRMNTERSVYSASAGSNPKLLSKIAVPDLLTLAAETALIKSKATIYLTGRYSVVLASANNKLTANKNTQKFIDSGYPAKNSTAIVNGKNYTRSKIKGFKSLNAARLFLKQVNNDLNIKDAWILKES